MGEFILMGNSGNAEISAMNESLSDRVAKVRAWLNENVLVPELPRTVTVSDIEFDWKKMSGTFVVALDGNRIEDHFRVWIGITGKPQFCPPMFVSPLGAPASYAAVDLDQETDKAIQVALEQVFPKVRAFGWHKDIDLVIDAMTPFTVRIHDQADFDAKRQAIESGGISQSATVGTT